LRHEREEVGSAEAVCRFLRLGDRRQWWERLMPGADEAAVSRRRFLAPLALAQFICSFAGSNMNVMINDITEDLDTSVQGVQATITLFCW
jgi:hypothetical protein